MFNPTPQRVPPQAWAPDTVLQPARQGEAGFDNTDWNNVPRLDYRTEKFRQLAVPDPARVVEDASAFEPWQPRQLADASQVADASTDLPAPAAAKNDEQRGLQALASEPRGGADAAVTEGSIESAQQASLGETDDMPGPQEAKHPSPSPDTELHTQSSDDLGADADRQEGKTKSGSSEAIDQRALDTNEADKKLSGFEDETLAAADRPGRPEPSLDSAAVQEACEAARQAGLEQGREEGLAQGREQALEEARQEHEASLVQAAADKAQALDQLRQELEGEIDPLKRQLNKAVEQVQSLVGQPDQLYEHIKRLSLHLAEQLVLGELNLSSAAIERLIQRCLDELDLHGNHVVTVELNPQDKARLQERAGEMSQALSVQAVSSLQPGSVRVMINDTLVEDLVGHRLDALARSLLVQPEVWRDQSPFFRQPLAQRDSEVQDAAARVVASRDTKPKASVTDSVDVPIASHPSDVDSDQSNEASTDSFGESLNLGAMDSEKPQNFKEESND